MSDANLLLREEFFVDGQFSKPQGTGWIDVISPNTGELFGRVPDASVEDIDRAVQSARRAFDEGPFPHWTPQERSEALTRLSQALQKRAPELADVITRTNGCPASTSIGMQVFASTMVLDMYADIAAQYEWVDERPGAISPKVRVRRAPVGVCAAIIPWNVPLYIAAMKLGPALSAGCTVVVKAAPETPYDALMLAEAVDEAGYPPGVVNVVVAGRETSEALVRHPGVDKVSFTGSTVTGGIVGGLCGAEIKRCTLELGGKSAAILLEDVDLEAHLDSLLGSGLMNNGQACGAQTRILAPRARYDEVVEAMASAVGAMKLGDSTDPETNIGPVVTARQRDRIADLLASAHAEGARAATGGSVSSDLPGWFIEPTIFADVNNGMRIAQEEIFGPVLSVIPYEGDDEAVAIANDSQYGLCGSVWTQDIDRGAAIAARVRTGVVAINSAAILDFRAPFGGFKKSGLGRELGPEGIAPYTELQSIILPG